MEVKDKNAEGLGGPVHHADDAILGPRRASGWLDALAALERAAIGVEIENRLSPTTSEEDAEIDRIIRRLLRLPLARFEKAADAEKKGDRNAA